MSRHEWIQLANGRYWAGDDGGFIHIGTRFWNANINPGYRWSPLLALAHTEARALVALLPEVKAALGALRAVEWCVPVISNWETKYRCPWCLMLKEHGHAGNCTRQAALAAFEVGDATD